MGWAVKVWVSDGGMNRGSGGALARRTEEGIAAGRRSSLGWTCLRFRRVEVEVRWFGSLLCCGWRWLVVVVYLLIVACAAPVIS